MLEPVGRCERVLHRPQYSPLSVLMMMVGSGFPLQRALERSALSLRSQRSVRSFLFAHSARTARWAFQTLRSGPSALETEAGDSDQLPPTRCRPPVRCALCVPYNVKTATPASNDCFPKSLSCNQCPARDSNPEPTD